MSKDYIARAKIDTHEQVCVERYTNIDSRLATLQNTLTASSTQFHERLNGLSSRMWGLLIASLGGTVVAIAALAFFLLTSRFGT